MLLNSLLNLAHLVILFFVVVVLLLLLLLLIMLMLLVACSFWPTVPSHKVFTDFKQNEPAGSPYLHMNFDAQFK